MLSVYVTGTDTGIGKTEASVALLHALRARGRNAAGMKPVASGCERVGNDWRNADALALQAASDPAPPYALVNPVALSTATAPEIAAAAQGVQVDLAPLCEAYARLAMFAATRVVEGVGGWCAPLSPNLDQSALVHALDLPVVLVVGLRLGCINHARLTARAIEADGCRLLGWIGNHLDPEFDHAQATIDILTRHLPSPCLGLLPFRRDSERAVAAELNLVPMAGLPA
jgi:dethiobiotin synthetase